MLTSNLPPKWWQLYLILPLLVALFVVDSRLRISTRGHQVVQIGAVLLVYGLIHLWLRANSRPLPGMDRIQDHGTFKVLHIPSDPILEKRPTFHLPDSELKGLLSDTFEMDIIDAEFLPIDEVSQESKKE